MEPQVVAAIIAAGVGVLTLASTVAVQISGRHATSRDLKEQLDRTLTERRTRTLNERFATAAGQLGSDKPPEVRLAGVYAMAGSADDWQDNQKNQQTCVDVLFDWDSTPPSGVRLPVQPDTRLSPGAETEEMA